MTVAPEQLTLEDADHAASFAWREAVDVAIRQCAVSGREFTADDVRVLLSDGDRGVVDAHPNAYGARFQAARKAGRIVAVGARASDRPASHGRLLRVWRGSS